MARSSSQVDPAIFKAQLAQASELLAKCESLAQPVREELARLDVALGADKLLLKRFEDFEAALKQAGLLNLKKPLIEAQEQELGAARKAKEAEPAEAALTGQDQALAEQRKTLPGLEAQLRSCGEALLATRAALRKRAQR